MRMVIVLFIVTGCVLQLTAQVNNDSMRMQYKNKTFKTGNGITMNGYKLEKNEVQNLMLISPEARGYYQQYLKNKKTATIFPIIALATSITGIFVTQKNKNAGIAIIYGGNLFNIAGALFRRKANLFLQDAVWTYNRDVLFPLK